MLLCYCDPKGIHIASSSFRHEFTEDQLVDFVPPSISRVNGRRFLAISSMLPFSSSSYDDGFSSISAASLQRLALLRLPSPTLRSWDLENGESSTMTMIKVDHRSKAVLSNRYASCAGRIFKVSALSGECNSGCGHLGCLLSWRWDRPDRLGIH